MFPLSTHCNLSILLGEHSYPPPTMEVENSCNDSGVHLGGKQMEDILTGILRELTKVGRIGELKNGTYIIYIKTLYGSYRNLYIMV